MNPNDPLCTEAERAAIVRAADSIVADALRYRWLRDESPLEWRLTVGDLECFKFDYDAAIDAALLQLTEGK